MKQEHGEYKYTDFGTQASKLKKQHAAHAAFHEQQKLRGKAVFPIWSLDKALDCLRKRIRKFRGETSKYKQPKSGLFGVR